MNPCRHLRVAAVAAALALTGCAGESDRAEVPRTSPPRNAPNIVVVMTDDQAVSSFPSAMPEAGLLARDGIEFTQSFASYPLCCPSRATFFTGQLAHNNGVLGNKPDEDGGGYENLADPERVLPAWLRSGGYETTHIGKFVHGYEGEGPPPGWDRFWGFTDEQGNYFNYGLRGPGAQVTEYGERNQDYATSVITRLAEREIEGLGKGRPLFLSIGYSAPHTGSGRAMDADSPCAESAVGKSAAQPAPLDLKRVNIQPLEAIPSLNERDVSDKPTQIQKRARLGAAELDQIALRKACSVAALAEVDRGVGRIVDSLRERGVLENTVIVFTSDNGLFYGEHRIPGDKNRPYEEAIRVPLVIRAPGFGRGTVVDPVMNADLAPTLIELAGVGAPGDGEARTQDGRSLVPLMQGEVWSERVIPIEGRSPGTASRTGGFQVRSYEGVRSSRYLFVNYYEEGVESVDAGLDVEPGTGEVIDSELYDLERDPHQITNLIGDPRYADAKRDLEEALGVLSDCSGESCFLEKSISSPD